MSNTKTKNKDTEKHSAEIFFKTTVVGDNINIIKTTFELNFDFYQTLKQHGCTKIWKQREAVNLKSFTKKAC